jgi:DNA-binding transcriptional LysR family regulator
VDNFGQLNVFIQAAETRNFTLAGRNLGISSSGVGKAVARLEERLGVRLFHRSTRSIALTPEGEVFLERCQRIQGEIVQAEAELTEGQGAPRGRLRVSLPLVGMLMMPALTGFMRAYPSVELDLDFTDRIVDLINEGFDVVVRTGEASDSQLITRTLGTFGHRLVGAPAYFARHGAPATPEDLLGHACLHHKYPATGKLAPWRLLRDGAELSLDLPRSVVASTIEPLVQMAEQGMGLACLPDYAVHAQLQDGRLVPVLDPYVVHRGVFRALWPQSRFNSPKVKLFVDFLAGALLPAQSSAQRLSAA